MKRRFVNLVTHNWLQRVYSLRRIDPYDHFFYGSAKAAIEAAKEAAEKNESFPAMENLQLPNPSMNFPATALDMFALLGPRSSSQGKLVYANLTGEAGLYDADNVSHISLGRLKSPKGFKPMCLSVAHPDTDEDCMYILDRYPGRAGGRCFEVLEPMRMQLSSCRPPFRWRLLPSPPFVRLPGYTPSPITSFTTLADDKGRSTIYVSFDYGINTYSFEMAHPDSGPSPSEKWSHVGDWKLPFHGRAQYIPEFKLWFGFLSSSPNHLCAVDLSAMGHQGPPTAEPQTWEDLNLPEGEVWNPMHLNLVHLGDGKFLIAKSFETEGITEQFVVLTGIEMIAGVGDDRKLRMVKHKCARVVFRSDAVEWVL